MKRIALTDGSGKWFDFDNVESFEEATFHDGNNHISRATNSQWTHEILYRTPKGRWILHWWSQWQGSRERYEEVGDERAASWLSVNEHEPHEACKTEFAALEIG